MRYSLMIYFTSCFICPNFTRNFINFQIADGIMKIYDTNLCKFDCLAIKTCLLFYMFINVETTMNGTLILMLEQLILNLENVTVFGHQLRGLKQSSDFILTKSMVSMMACFTSDYNHFQTNADKISSAIIPQKINNERDLYR